MNNFSWLFVLGITVYDTAFDVYLPEDFLKASFLIKNQFGL